MVLINVSAFLIGTTTFSVKRDKYIHFAQRDLTFAKYINVAYGQNFLFAVLQTSHNRELEMKYFCKEKMTIKVHGILYCLWDYKYGIWRNFHATNIRKRMSYSNHVCNIKHYDNSNVFSCILSFMYMIIKRI